MEAKPASALLNAQREESKAARHSVPGSRFEYGSTPTDAHHDAKHVLARNEGIVGGRVVTAEADLILGKAGHAVNHYLVQNAGDHHVSFAN